MPTTGNVASSMPTTNNVASLLEIAPDAIVVVDAAGGILLVNAQTERLFGYRREELLGKPVETLLPDRHRDAHFHHRKQFQGSPRLRPMGTGRELYGRRKDGSEFAVDVSLSPFRGDAGFQVIAAIRDITDRKLAEAMLKRSEAYLAEAQALTRTGSWAWDPRCDRVLHCSDEVFRIYALDPQKGLPNSEMLLERVHPQDRDRVREGTQQSIRRKEERLLHYRIVLPDGTIKYIESLRRPVLDDEGNTVEVISTSVDVTEHRHAEQALQRSEAYLTEAQQLTHTGSWAWDPKCDTLLHCSEEVFRIYGLDPNDGMPTFDTLQERVHPDDRERVRQGTLLGLQDGTERVLEFRILLPDGSIKYIESVRHPVLDDANRLLEIVGTSVEVTERKRAELERERLRKLDADLAHVNRVSMLGELAVSLAHEIRQPLTAVILNANTCVRWLESNPPDVEKACTIAEQIERDGARAAEIIKRVYSLYKKETPRQREAVDINQIIREMIALLHSELTRNSISVRPELANDIGDVMVDRVEIQQVLLNLLLNAIQAMRDKAGELTVKSRTNEDSQVLISVSDTGVGLPANNVDAIFDPFFTTKRDGTGVGLTLTRSIVEAHGGRIWASANAGRGATFYFTLPKDRS